MPQNESQNVMLASVFTGNCQTSGARTAGTFSFGHYCLHVRRLTEPRLGRPDPDKGLRGTWGKRAGAIVLASMLVAGCTLGAQGSTRPFGHLTSFVSGARSDERTPAQAIDLAGIRRVVGLGDSVTAGTGCDCRGFVAEVADAVSAKNGHPVEADNFGEPGLTAAQLRSQVASDGELRSRLADAQLVLVTVGANDLAPLKEADPGCGPLCSVPAVAADVEDVRATLDEIHAVTPATLVVTSYWNVFPDGAAEPDPATRIWGDQVTRVFNVTLDHAVASDGAILVDTYAAFKGDGDRDPTDLLADDGDHPNAAGHEVIAGQIVATISDGVPPSTGAHAAARNLGSA